MDLFASRHNTQCKLYVSYRPDPGCMAVDAFSLNWHSIMFYAFPPFSVLTQTIQKIEKEEATGLVVAPNWPTQVWYPALMRLLIAHPLLISPDKSNLSLPCYRQEIHPLHKTCSCWFAMRNRHFRTSYHHYAQSLAPRYAETI